MTMAGRLLVVDDLRRELADGVMQGEPWLGAADCDDVEKAVVDQVGQEIECLAVRRVGASAGHGVCGRETEAPGEHARAAE